MALPTRVGPQVGVSPHRDVSGHRLGRCRTESYRAMCGGCRRADSSRATGGDVAVPTRFEPPVAGVAVPTPGGHESARRRPPPIARHESVARRRGGVWRREDGERGTSKRTGRSERVESS